MKFLKNFYRSFSNDIGIDLGTANTLVYLSGKGIVINEPSVVAVNQKTGQIVAIGAEAKKMIGRTPGHIKAVRPLVEGVVSDFEVTEEMLAYYINKADKMVKKMFRPRVVVGVPSGITNVETRAVYDAAKSAGAREVYIVEEPMAAAIGIRMPVHDASGSMIIDIGGGTTDVAVISLAGVIQSKSLNMAGDKLNADIVSYFRDEFKILVGEKTAEEVKIKVGSALPLEEPIETPVRGRDLVTGLPREVIVTDADIREAIMPSLKVLIDGVRQVIENTPPEILSDIMGRGIVLTGGGSLIRGLDIILQKVSKMPIYVAEEPLTAVARGTGIILQDFEKYKDVLVSNDDELPLR
jgi:rod shape-determining protein MreB